MSGESKQIDEDENGPENGGLKSGPCLIAGFHALSCTSPSYYNPYRGVNKKKEKAPASLAAAGAFETRRL